MGVVYLAEHEVIEKQVAIKLLRDEYIGDETLVTRFFNEARAAAAAKHPGIVEIIDVGYDQGQAFIMMELIEGVTLGRYLRNCERLSPMESMDLTRQVASALSAAHKRNVVHRDLKPSNIMLVPSNSPNRHATKVFDFGIAKLFGDNSSHTRTGILMGTPTYMSPEQCKGAAKVDHRSDLYSLGCILYSLLTGKRVFSGEGEGEVIAKHIYEPPVPPSDLASMPPELETIILRLLEKDPANRYQSTKELIAALDEVIAGLSASEQVHTAVFQSERRKMALPVGEPMTPTPRARVISLDSLVPEIDPDPDPDSGHGTPLATQGRTVHPEPTITGRRGSLTAVIGLLVGAAAISVFLYLRTELKTTNTGAASGGVSEDLAPAERQQDEVARPGATDPGLAVLDAGSLTGASAENQRSTDAAPEDPEETVSKGNKGKGDKGKGDKGKGDKGKGDKGKGDKSKGDKSKGDKGKEAGAQDPGKNDKGPKGPRTLNPFE